MSPLVSRRWIFLVVAFVLLCFFGLIYAWSLFIEPLETSFGWQRSETSLIFTISCVTVCIGMVLSGVLESIFNHRIIMVGAAAVIAIGFFASAFCQSLVEIFIYYGVLVGTGVGIGFNCAINTALKWFPDKQGVASGALLMGYGGGAMFLSPLVTSLLQVLDWRVTFGVLGVLFGAVVVLGAVILKNPPAEEVAPLLEKAREANIVSEVDFTPMQMIKTTSFWTSFIWLTICTSGGLALISQAVPAAVEVLGPQAASGAGLAAATAAMGCVSLCNGIGRLINGFIWDRIGFRVSLFWVSFTFVAGMFCCALAIGSKSFVLLIIGFVLLGLMFGGTMSCTSAVVGTFFGTKHFGISYAIMCCQMIPAAFIGPTLLALTQTGSGSYNLAFWVFFGVALVALLFSVTIRRPKCPEASAQSTVARGREYDGDIVAQPMHT